MTTLSIFQAVKKALGNLSEEWINRETYSKDGVKFYPINDLITSAELRKLIKVAEDNKLHFLISSDYETGEKRTYFMIYNQ